MPKRRGQRIPAMAVRNLLLSFIDANMQKECIHKFQIFLFQEQDSVDMLFSLANIMASATVQGIFSLERTLQHKFFVKCILSK